MEIKILGMGTENSKILKSLTDDVVNELRLNTTPEKVDNIEEIKSYGVKEIPAIVINDKVKSYGRIPSKDEIKHYIQDELS